MRGVMAAAFAEENVSVCLHCCGASAIIARVGFDSLVCLHDHCLGMEMNSLTTRSRWEVAVNTVWITCLGVCSDLGKGNLFRPVADRLQRLAPFLTWAMLRC